MANLGGVDSSKVIVIDTETTGTRPGKDEILSLSIIDGNEKVIFNDLIKPSFRKRWPDATKINGITYKDVQEKQTLLERKNEILYIFKQASIVVGYNVDFDLKMLQAGEVYPSCAKTFDVMKEYARLLPNGRWVKLIECAHNYGYDYVPHDSLNDVRATLHCYKKLLQDSRYIELINRQEQKKKEDESKRTNYKTTSVFLFIASAFLLFSSCSISQSFSGTLGIIGLSIFLFFAGIIFWALGSE